MGTYAFRLPDVGEGSAEAELVAWHVKPGDEVLEDQHLVDVMTEKATVEIPAPRAGTVLSITGAPGEMLAVGSTILVLEVAGTNDSEASDTSLAHAPVTKASAPTTMPQAVTAVVEPSAPATIVVSSAIAQAPIASVPPLQGEGGQRPEGVGPPPQPSPLQEEGVPPSPMQDRDTRRDKPIAAPAVRRRAWEEQIDLHDVRGTGPAGRITHEDIDAVIRAGGARQPASSAGLAKRTATEDIKIIGLRRQIATRMQDAKRRIPHFSYIEEIDVTDLETLRAALNAQHGSSRGKLTVLPFLARALVRTLPDYPQINARFHDDDGFVRRHAGVHLGVATQTPTGLVVPVVHNAEALTLWECAAEIARLAAAAREGKAARDDLSGSTITITSLGALGGLATTPVINYPEVAIVGVNKMVERPIVRSGQIVVRTMMNLSSSFDHRVVDGFDAAAFVQRLRALLETPALLFVE